MKKQSKFSASLEIPHILDQFSFNNLPFEFFKVMVKFKFAEISVELGP